MCQARCWMVAPRGGFSGAWYLEGGLKSRDCLRLWFGGTEAEGLGRGSLQWGVTSQGNLDLF